MDTFIWPPADTSTWPLTPTASEGRTLIFKSFLPNMIAMPGALENHIAYQATRSRFAAEHVGN